MNKKRVDTSAIQNELEGSAFFRSPSSSSQPAQASQLPTAPSIPPAHTPALQERTIEDPNVRSFERPETRQQVRHSFDIFADQLLALRSIALEREGMSGKRVLLGDLVQQALDTFITKERSVERTNERNTERPNER